jgi:hypothetical protein
MMLDAKLCTVVIESHIPSIPRRPRALADLNAAGQMIDPSARVIDGERTSQLSRVRLSASTVTTAARTGLMVTGVF